MRRSQSIVLITRSTRLLPPTLPSDLGMNRTSHTRTPSSSRSTHSSYSSEWCNLCLVVPNVSIGRASMHSALLRGAFTAIESSARFAATSSILSSALTTRIVLIFRSVSVRAVVYPTFSNIAGSQFRD